jgi:sec-independent protein translocase protein TatA
MPSVGPAEIVLLLLVALVIFGPKKLPDIGRAIGEGMREFRDSVTKDVEDEAPLTNEAPMETRPPAPEHVLGAESEAEGRYADRSA